MAIDQETDLFNTDTQPSSLQHIINACFEFQNVEKDVEVIDVNEDVENELMDLGNEENRSAELGQALPTKVSTLQSAEDVWPTNFQGAVTVSDCRNKRLKLSCDHGKDKLLDLNMQQWEVVENVSPMRDCAGPAPREVSSQSGSVQGYKVKNVYKPILQAIIKHHGDIAATCVFTDAAMRTCLLEAVCDIVLRIETNDVTNTISNMKELESKVYVAEAAKINVSWLQAHLEAMKEAGEKATMLMELKTKTSLVKKAAQTDLNKRHAKLVAAQTQFLEAKRSVEALKLVEEKLNNNVVESKAGKNLWTLGRTPDYIG